MTPVEVAARLEHYARRVRELRGVSRRNPHQFAEDKSELAGAMLDEARALRTVTRPKPDPTTFRPGIKRIGGREVRVEIRRKAG